jgi:hypothetical protein
MEEFKSYNVPPIALLGALAVSFGVGYALGGRKLRAKYIEAQSELEFYQNKLEDQTSLVKEYERENLDLNGSILRYAASAERAENALKGYRGEQELVAAATEVAENAFVPDAEDQTAWAIPKYIEEAIQDNIVTPEQHISDKFGPAAAQPKRESRVDKNKPYVVSSDEALSNEANYSSSTITYYEGDDTLCGEGDDILDDASRLLTVGTNLSDFGTMSGDPNVVYIRNDQIQMYLEVLRDERKYSEVVAGLGDSG